MSYLASLQNSCQEEMQKLAACTTNAKLHLFGVEPLPRENVCKCDDAHINNPHVLGDSAIKPILISLTPTGIGGSKMARLDEGPAGVVEMQRREITIPFPANRIHTDMWAYLEMEDDLIGGKVDGVTRDSPPFVTILLNTSKPVPFSPTLAEIRDWPRRIQN